MLESTTIDNYAKHKRLCESWLVCFPPPHCVCFTRWPTVKRRGVCERVSDALAVFLFSVISWGGIASACVDALHGSQLLAACTNDKGIITTGLSIDLLGNSSSAVDTSQARPHKPLGPDLSVPSGRAFALPLCRVTKNICLDMAPQFLASIIGMRSIPAL